MAVPADELGRRADAAPRVGADASLAALAATGLRSLTDIVSHFFEVVALESRAAGTALATSIGLIIAIAVLGLTVWGLIIAAMVSALVDETGMTIALLIVAGGNIVVAGLLGIFLPRMLRRLSFPSTRKMFRRSGS